MNQIVLIGRLTADPVLEKTESGVSKCKFSLAVQDGATNKNGEKEVDFINSIAWRSTAEFISKYFKKGSMIGVIGKLKVRPSESVITLVVALSIIRSRIFSSLVLLPSTRQGTYFELYLFSRTSNLIALKRL